MAGYPHDDIETRWHAYWDRHETFRQPGPGDDGFDAAKPGFYALDMFPYPSGVGLHVGHPEGYTATDILARYKRMTGFHVLHPMGWDAFGLPAEEYARKTGTHPRLTTATNVETFRRQIQSLGFSYDWDREVDTTDPDYFRWTQFIFLTLHDTWYDAETNRGRPISELPIPAWESYFSAIWASACTANQKRGCSRSISLRSTSAASSAPPAARRARLEVAAVLAPMADE